MLSIKDIEDIVGKSSYPITHSLSWHESSASDGTYARSRGRCSAYSFEEKEEWQEKEEEDS